MTMRFHIRAGKMTYTRKTRKSEHPHLKKMQKFFIGKTSVSASLRKRVWLFLKTKRELSYDPVISILGIPGHKIHYLKRHMDMSVYCSAIYPKISQDVETAQVSTTGE